MAGMTGGLLDALIIHHKSLMKSALWVCFILAFIIVIPAMACNGLYNWAIDYHRNYQAANNPPSTEAIGSPTTGPTATPGPLDSITVDTDALKRNNPYPVQFSRDPGKDPKGAYYNMALNFGLGPFPGVYIVPDAWRKAGGRVVITPTIPENYIYYNVFTNKGTSSSMKYDRQKNIVYTMSEENPILS